MKLSIIDLDGTICDERHRNQFARRKEWDNYHEMLAYDKPMNLDLLEHTKDFIVMTGRPITHLLQTKEWFIKNKVKFPRMFKMRLDYITSSRDMKQQWTEGLLTTGHDVVMAADDRHDICLMYRNLGIPKVIFIEEGVQHEFC